MARFCCNMCDGDAKGSYCFDESSEKPCAAVVDYYLYPRSNSNDITCD